MAELARIELKKGEEEKLLKDLEKILAHFEELNEVDTKAVEPMVGGTFLTNISRQDGEGERLPGDKAVAAFPETQKGFLKIPPVFE